MDQKHNITLCLTKIHCIKDSTESGSDEVYFEIYKEGTGEPEVKYKSNPMKMKHDDVRAVDLNIVRKLCYLLDCHPCSFLLCHVDAVTLTFLLTIPLHTFPIGCYLLGQFVGQDSRERCW